MCLTDANGVALGFVVHAGEADGFLAALGEDGGIPRGGIDGEALAVLKFALGLDLDAAALAIAEIGGDLEAAVGQTCLLNAGRGNGTLHHAVHEHELFAVLIIIFCCKLYLVSTNCFYNDRLILFVGYFLNYKLRN